MAYICITTSEKSEKEQIKNKIQAHLPFLTVKELSIQNLCIKDTVYQFYYCEILERPRKRVVRVRPSIGDNWMLPYDNAPCHTAIPVIKFLAKRGIPVVPQPDTPLI